ncbi:MAG TPA: hypothetical protein PK781_03335 [Terrimesophilobacter sp.]|nr:hypothetical protein [Terrimesophilobacter sp.]HRP99475.1 hypothetical protein [Terrimesophilobacter sp.]
MNSPTPIAFVQFRPELTPGQPFRAPAQWILPHAGDFWGTPKHIIESIDPEYGDWACLGTYSIEPANEHLKNHWVYQAIPGDTYAWHDEDTDRTIYQRYLGVYRLWGLSPNNWATGTVNFMPHEKAA